MNTTLSFAQAVTLPTDIAVGLAALTLICGLVLAWVAYRAGYGTGYQDGELSGYRQRRRDELGNLRREP